MFRRVLNKLKYIHNLFLTYIAVLCVNFLTNTYLMPHIITPNLLFTENPPFTLRTPYEVPINFNLYINYSLLIDREFKFVVFPKACSEDPLLLMILVTSDVNHIRLRKIIRKSWGQAQSDAVKIIFTVGLQEHNEANESIVDVEGQTYEDILQGDFVDSYENLTYKTMMGLKWVVHHCPSARYVVKMDDDVFLNVFKLQRFLSRQLSPWGAQGLMAGIIWHGKRVHRDAGCKYFVPREEFSLDVYPPYCAGGFVIYSQDLLPFLVEASEVVNYMHIEDVYTTGILADYLKIGRTFLPHVYFIERDYIDFKKRERKCTMHKHAFFGPLLTRLDDLAILWNVTSKEYYEDQLLRSGV